MEPVTLSGEEMVHQTLTDRQRRERRYYDEYVKRTQPEIASLAAIRGEERRPWNAYWYVAELLRRAFEHPGQRLLDFGCGPGSYAVQFAHLGYHVTGFDVSPANIAAAWALASQYGLEERVEFSVGVAERLEYPEASFDAIVGIDILHHVDIRLALPECLRVLKPGGVAIFKEPVSVPILDRLRNTRLGQKLKPSNASFERHITEDERKLTSDDLALIRARCRVEERRFRVLSRIEALVGTRFRTATGASRLEIMDQGLLRLCPPLGRLGGEVVLVCRHH